jgi:hypothetical protein
MNRAAAARPSGADAEPEPWERAAFPAAVHSDPIELAGAKRALKAFFFRLLPDDKGSLIMVTIRQIRSNTSVPLALS